MLASLGGGHLNDLARSSFQHNKAIFAQGWALHGVGGGCPGITRLEVQVCICHACCGSKHRCTHEYLLQEYYGFDVHFTEWFRVLISLLTQSANRLFECCRRVILQEDFSEESHRQNLDLKTLVCWKNKTYCSLNILYFDPLVLTVFDNKKFWQNWHLCVPGSLEFTLMKDKGRLPFCQVNVCLVIVTSSCNCGQVMTVNF